MKNVTPVTSNDGSYTGNYNYNGPVTPNMTAAVSPLLSRKLHDEPEPEDNGNVVYWIFLLWGIGILLPWNAVLTCFDFFSDEMPGYKPAFVYPFAVNGLNSFFQFLIVLQGHKVSDRVKVQMTFFCLGILIVILPLLTHFLSTPEVKFYGTFTLLLVFGMFNGVVQGQVFGLGGILPPKYMGAIMFGIGLSGILMNVLRLIFVITLPDSTLYFQSLIFFIISGVILLACSVCYSILMKNEFYRYFKDLKKNKDQRFVDLRVTETMYTEEAFESYL
jgi:equilibrative nucleoside transporter 1/2/3